MYVCMYVCMPVISSYLGAPCPTPRGTGQVLTNSTIEVGKDVKRLINTVTLVIESAIDKYEKESYNSAV